MTPLSDSELISRLLTAALLGALLGFEREIKQKSAGLRTNILIAVGSALFTLMSYELAESAGADPGRVAAQIVTGIGFLGAGAIIRHGLSIRGLTTAASLWLVAAIGMASGAGYWQAALIATVGAIVTLWPLRILTHPLFQRLRPSEPRLFVELATGGGAAPVLDTLETLEVRVDAFRVEDDRDGRHVALEVEVPEERREAVVPAVARLEKVTGVRWSD